MERCWWNPVYKFTLTNLGLHAWFERYFPKEEKMLQRAVSVGRWAKAFLINNALFLCLALTGGLHALNTGRQELNTHNSPQFLSLSETSIWWLTRVSAALISHVTQCGKNRPLLSMKIFKVMPLSHLFCTSAGDKESNKSSHIWVVNNA